MNHYDQLIQTLAGKMNIRPDILRTAVQSGDPKALLSLLDAEKSAALEKLLSDPQKLKQALNSKQAKEMQKEIKP